jgi:hypothetical protein
VAMIRNLSRGSRSSTRTSGLGKYGLNTEQEVYTFSI